MGQNILITGAAGYIGGSVLANFISLTDSPIKSANLFAAVRTEEQVQALSKLGVNVILLDLHDAKAVMDAVLSNKIGFVIHTASSIITSLALNLIQALGQRRKDSGREVYFVHTSVTTMFSEEGGWPFGEVRDTDPIYEKEKQIAPGNPVRGTNILVVEDAKAHDVTSFIVPVPFVYGRGTGEWRKLCVNIPNYIRTSIANQTVYKFDKEGIPPAAHISDLVSLYTILTEKILQGEKIPSGEIGYYFAMAHRAPWWSVMQRLAEALHARGLVESPDVKVWPSREMAAESMGLPPMYLEAMTMSSGELVPVNAYKLGWKPKWDETRFLNSMDDEVKDVLELGTKKATLFDALLEPGQ